MALVYLLNLVSFPCLMKILHKSKVFMLIVLQGTCALYLLATSYAPLFFYGSFKILFFSQYEYTGLSSTNCLLYHSVWHFAFIVVISCAIFDKDSLLEGKGDSLFLGKIVQQKSFGPGVSDPWLQPSSTYCYSAGMANYITLTLFFFFNQMVVRPHCSILYRTNFLVFCNMDILEYFPNL